MHPHSHLKAHAIVWIHHHLREANMRKYISWFVLLLCLCNFLPLAAQNEPVCPAKILLSLSRSGSACFGLDRNEACYGNGGVQADFQLADAAMSFAQPGDIVTLG